MTHSTPTTDLTNILRMRSAISQGQWHPVKELSLRFELSSSQGQRIDSPELLAPWSKDQLRKINKRVLCNFVSLCPQCCHFCSVSFLVIFDQGDWTLSPGETTGYRLVFLYPLPGSMASPSQSYLSGKRHHNTNHETGIESTIK